MGKEDSDTKSVDWFAKEGKIIMGVQVLVPRFEVDNM